MRVLKAAKAEHAAGVVGAAGPLLKPATGALPAADAYSVLGLALDVASAEVKKRYMRLSLLIHPDKCQHKVWARLHVGHALHACCRGALHREDTRSMLRVTVLRNISSSQITLTC
jgi:hypothetical protein